MIEIALSIAVVSFALVAIIGVLPTGLTVQQDNREDILINQEGQYWLQLIKSGARGAEDITNFVEFVAITNLTKPSLTKTFVNDATTPLRAADIISLLSTVKYNTAGQTNKVVARVRPITGPAGEKSSLTNDVLFRYELQAEITPGYPLPPTFASGLSSRAIAYNEILAANLAEVRLILRWPVVQRGNGWFVGNNSKTFRAKVAGTFVPVPPVDLSSAVNGMANLVLLPNKFEINTNFWNGAL
jgi:hypothetical protein